jgi:hypothetical protein
VQYSTNPVDHLKKLASDAGDLSQLSPEEFVKAIADMLPVLAIEFSTVSLTITRRCVAQFCEDLRRGMFERAVHEGVEASLPEDMLRAEIDPTTFILPNRVEKLARLNPAVHLKLTPDQARLLALDLSWGVMFR